MQSIDGSIANRVDAMAKVVEKYTTNLAVPTSNPPNSAPKYVALTGSTGSLGKHLLMQLIATPNVTKVYCLDRSADASSKHPGLVHLNKKPAVEFLEVSYQHPDFDLSTDKFTELINSVDIIIHAAWKVDFNHSLSSFEPVHIRGIRNLIGWNIHSPRRPHIVFISSTSSVSRWPSLGGNDDCSNHSR